MADIGDEKQVKTKKAAHVLAREKELAELHALLQTYGGRAFLWRLLEQCGLYSSAPEKGMERFEGKRDVGLWAVEEAFTADANAYNIMKNEAVSRDTTSKDI